MQPGRKMVQCSLLLREIFFALLDIRLDGITAKFPVLKPVLEHDLIDQADFKNIPES